MVRRVLTVEHVMAAVAAHKLDNLVVEVDGPEVPIRDGSFGDYFDALSEARPIEQDQEASVLQVKGPVPAELESWSIIFPRHLAQACGFRRRSILSIRGLGVAMAHMMWMRGSRMR